jgi:hypothetical protein
MSAHLRPFCVLLAALGLALAGCESTEAPKTFVSEDNLASTKDEAMALAEALPSAEEVATPSAKAEPAKAPAKAASAAPSTAKPAPAAKATSRGAAAAKITSVSPDESPFEGSVVLLNLQKGFVIVDFGKGKVPPARSELGVYRGGIFVGSVRITPPIKPPLASADILNGTLRRGDTVR